MNSDSMRGRKGNGKVGGERERERESMCERGRETEKGVERKRRIQTKIQTNIHTPTQHTHILALIPSHTQ